MRKLALSTALIAGSASAQVTIPTYIGNWGWQIQSGGQLASRVINQNILEQQLKQATKGNHKVDGPDADATQRDTESSDRELKFISSAQRRRADYAQFVEKSRRADPAGAANLAANLASDPIAQMGPELAKVGLSTNNVADAYTVYWTEAWEAAHGVTSEGSREQAQAVKQQAAAAILATPEFQHATDAQKQEFADALLVQGLLIGATADQAHGDENKLRQIGAAVRQGARAMGLDLDAMTLTDHGFVPADRTGAADPAPGTEPRALAADGHSGDHPAYGLLAAAGGAGLGAALLIGRAMGRKG